MHPSGADLLRKQTSDCVVGNENGAAERQGEQRTARVVHLRVGQHDQLGFADHVHQFGVVDMVEAQRDTVVARREIGDELRDPVI